MFIESEKSKPETYLPINEAAVSGSISAGIGFTQLSELCATMDIPCMVTCTYVLVQGFINNRIHNVAEAQMKIAGDEERRLAIEAETVDVDGIPMCTIVADGHWSKRCNKTKYDALSRVATIIGYRSKKMLFVGIRNRFYIICQRAKNKKLPEKLPEHTCFLNWKKDASSMEADRDGDSSDTKRLAEIMPYGPRLPVIKIECRNHLLRNYGTKLVALTLNTKYPISLRKHIKSNISRFRFSITKAIEYRLRKDINNSFRHILGGHDRCESYFCKAPQANEKNMIEDAERSGFVSEVSQIISRLVANVDSLLMNVDNNVCEQFNTGKRINYSQRNSYNARVETAVISCNSGGKFLRLMHKNIVNGISPGEIGKKMLASSEKKRCRPKSKKLLFTGNSEKKGL
ncbi:hypothetical protein AGLY_016608 [Aphis glycines]|uniref:Mutator-like transposase domain-containing protein n=1 Tax=Aphis glycines TaxID=307491 RepID=A0A6G0SZ95_APHGL|nr:hypothetical protein AGLY_016608 [Aphis glycines]